MRNEATSAWAGHALEALQEAGHRSGGARRQVVELLGREDCALTALEIDRRFDGVGRASVYRALEQLEELGLVQRVDLGTDAAGYERIEPGGHHHHHVVCERCGSFTPFEDPDLERAIGRAAGRLSFRVSAHDLTLRGTCPRCN